MTYLPQILLECGKDFFLHSSRKFFPTRLKLDEDSRHAKGAAEWLLRTTTNIKGGSSSHYNLLKNSWEPAFPETTGYLIPTLWDYYDFSQNSIYSKISELLSYWLVKVQLDNGACMLGHYRDYKGIQHSCIFNTGQNILGFIRSYEELGRDLYLRSAIKAGDFLVDSTNSQGIWNKYLHNNLDHTYNSRTSWSLLKLYAVTGDIRYQNIAIKNLNWVINQQRDNGWFENANFKKNELPNTHGIVYTLRGLLESYLICKEKKYLSAVELTSQKLLRIFEIRQELPTFWDSDWNSYNKMPGTTFYFGKGKLNFVCLTGYAQFSILLTKLALIKKDYRYWNTSLKLLDSLKYHQNIKTTNRNINGAIKGSFPIYGDYSFLSYPNWATKFFLDALLLQINLKKNYKNLMK